MEINIPSRLGLQPFRKMIYRTTEKQFVQVCLVRYGSAYAHFNMLTFPIKQKFKHFASSLFP